MDRRLKIRATLRVLILLFVIYTAGGIMASLYSRKAALKVADQIATRDIATLVQYTDNLLDECEISAYNLRGLIGYEALYSDTLYRVLERFLRVNPHIYGVALAFQPDMLARYPIITPATFFYGNRTEGFQHLRLDSLYDYPSADWYHQTLLDWQQHSGNACQAHWGHPMKASNGTLIAPFCVPLITPDSTFMGTMAVDIALEGLSDRLHEATPYPGVVITLIDQSGQVVASSSDGTSTETLGKRMQLTAAVERAGWTLSFECPYSLIYSEVDKMKWVSLANLILGLAIVIFICYRLFQRIEQYENVAAQKATMQGELQIAASIQKGMLPKLYPPFPDVKELDVYGMLIPAKEVGGDLFDYFIRDDKFFFCIGDVSGKGVPASLFMAVLRSLFRNVTLHTDRPADIAQALNKALAEGNEQNMFCTMWLGVMDIHTGHLRFCNCGHNAPLLRQKKSDGTFEVHYGKFITNMAIGILEDFLYQDEELFVQPGETIFLYTDGVTETESATKELYGEDRLQKALRAAREQQKHTVKELVEAVYTDVEAFAEKDYQSDDITMVMVEYRGSASHHELHLTNDVNRVPELAAWVDQVAEAAQLPADKTFQLNLALEEAVVNVMQYAYQGLIEMPILLSADVLPDKITFLLEDKGTPFDPTLQKEPDTTLSVEDRPIGGLGIMLVRQLMDEVRYEYTDGKNQLWMTVNKK